MKALKILIVIVLSLLALESTYAQKKIGVFIHGFQGSSEKWTEVSEVPENWEGGVIDDFIALDYETMELSPASREALIGKFIRDMDKEGDRVGDQWILIGHSLGGIVARRLYPEFREAGFNVVAVVSIGGPVQGAAATDVDPDYIEKRLEEMEDKFTEAYKYRRTYIQLGLFFLDLFNGTNYGTRINEIPKYIATARDSALGYTDHIIKYKANDLIGLEGSLIQEINSYYVNNVSLHPQNYLSIIGAEKDKAPIRMAGQIFTEEDDLKDEAEMIDLVQKLRDDYFTRHVNYYERLVDKYSGVHTTCRIFNPFKPSKCSGAYSDLQHARYRRSVWKDARREIDDLGKTWSTLINSYQITTVTVPTFIPPCDDAGDGWFLGKFRIQPIDGDEDCSSNPNGEVVYHTKQTQVADKNDGVVNVHSALWRKNHEFDGDHNIYMKDVNITPNGDDGGYNHFELRNYARQYTLEENGQVVFEEGDKNPAMERAELWIIREL